MKNILVPIGSSENAKNTLQYAVDFAQTINANVFAFRAFRKIGKAGRIINVDTILERENKAALKAVINAIDVKNVTVKMIASKASVLESILAIDKELGLDLIVVGPRSNSNKEELFLGKTTGSIVKKTNIPTLIVPEGFAFKPFKNCLVAVKSCNVKNDSILHPITFIQTKFNTVLKLLLVKTPSSDIDTSKMNATLKNLITKKIETENATIFQGVLEHLHEHNPDLLCVFRRERGFFTKLWEQNTVKKVDFNSRIPLLVLKGSL